MCRKCRHVKCIKVGMKIEAYQQSKDSTYDPNKSFKSSGYSPSIISPSSQTSNKSLDEMELDLFSQINAVFDDAIANPRTSTELTTLEMFRLGMNHLRQRRSVVHTEHLLDLDINMNDDEFAEAIQYNWTKIPDMVEREIYLYGELLSFVKPFLALPSDQRWILYKQFVLAFMRFERAYETYRILGDDRKDKRHVMFNGETIDYSLTYLKQCELRGKKIDNRTVSPYVIK